LKRGRRVCCKRNRENKHAEQRTKQDRFHLSFEPHLKPRIRLDLYKYKPGGASISRPAVSAPGMFSV
jgi:hypothetical protein